MQYAPVLTIVTDTSAVAHPCSTNLDYMIAHKILSCFSVRKHDLDAMYAQYLPDYIIKNLIEMFYSLELPTNMLQFKKIILFSENHCEFSADL